MSQLKNENTAPAMLDARKYARFPLSFRDPWAGAEAGADVEIAFNFAKPTKSQIKRLQDTAGKNPAQAARNILLDTIHPDEKAQLETCMDEYPGIATTFSTALIKAVGIANDLGN